MKMATSLIAATALATFVTSLHAAEASVNPLPEKIVQQLGRRMADLAPRFTQPSGDPAWVMPVGAGDLSAMLRYDGAWEIHLSKTDFFGWDKAAYHKNPTILSPGHVQVSFGIPRQAVRAFEQRMDFQRGSVMLEIKTDDGTLKAEAFGVMGRNTLVIAVDDARRIGHILDLAGPSCYCPRCARNGRGGSSSGRGAVFS